VILPLDAELNAESTGGKFAEGIGDDPKWDESGDEEDEDAGDRVRSYQIRWTRAGRT
jgi:hypothetical protein